MYVGEMTLLGLPNIQTFTCCVWIH